MIKHIKPGWKSWVMLPLAGMIIFIFGGISPAQAEPAGGLTPAGKVLMDLLGATVGSSSSYAPIKLQAECSHEIEECWKARGLNKANQDQVNDACWKEAKKCPKVCRDEYFSRRKAGMSSAMADPLFQGRRGEDTSCVPGVDERTHGGKKVKSNNSTLRVTVSFGGKPVAARVDVIPLDDKGNERRRTTASPNYSRSIKPTTSDLSQPLVIYAPAGQYRVQVRPDRYYGTGYPFPKQVETISLQDGQTLERRFDIKGGRLQVMTQDSDGKPVRVELQINSPDTKNDRRHNYRAPLDIMIPVGRYRMIVREIGNGRRTKSFDFKIDAGRTVTKTIIFSTVRR